MLYQRTFVGLLIIPMLVALGCQHPQQSARQVVRYTRDTYIAHLNEVAWKDGFSNNVVRFSDEPIFYAPNRTGHVVIVTCLNFTVCDGVWVKFKQSASDLDGGREAGFDEIDFFLEGSGSDVHRLEFH